MIKLSKKPVKLSRGLVYLAAFFVGLAAIGAFATDVWLASTQHLLVAIVVMTFAIYAKLEGN